jgi:hypothetical protein
MREERVQLQPHDAAATLRAGGIAPTDVELTGEERASPATARAYTHPALAGRVVIRVEPEAVAEGVDAEMAALGFGEPDVTRHLGAVRYRTLGFPAWALVHDPKKAKFALDVTEDIRKAKRLIAAKPGHARDAFEKIAKRLGGKAPHFLPSFWEEAGRAIADQASAPMAAQFFERARQAERAYKLKVDADDRDAVFVEFALLGAVSAKTLSAYAKELAKTEGGKEAYRRFRAIVVKRALGGMPPFSGMGKDLRALADAADLDADAEDDAILAELIEAPNVGKAPAEFWTTYRPSLARLAAGKPDVRARLRVLFPEPRGGTRESQAAFKASWFELLEQVGALADLPDDGLGAWMSRVFKYVGATDKTRQLLRTLAPRLVALGQPVAVVTPRGQWGTDLHLDLAELALELGVSLADPEHYDDFFAESMTCDPVRVAAEPRYAKKLVEAVAAMMGEAEHEGRMRRRAGFAAARRMWIEERLADLEQRALPGVKDALDSLESKTTAETFLEFPDLLERLGRVDLTGAVARTLRTGIVDEWAWPAYENAFRDLGGPVKLGGAFPYMTAWTASKAIALGPGGVVGEHDLVYKPSEHEIENVFFLDGQFLVVLDPQKGWQDVAYWSSAPKQRFDFKAYLRSYGGDVPTATTVPGGGVTFGGKAFRAGEPEVTNATNHFTDGTGMWLVHWQAGSYDVYGFDPIKGARTAKGAPAFLTGFGRDGWKPDYGACVMVAAPPGMTSSPLGIRDGVLGLRVLEHEVKDGENEYEVERIDGVRWKGRMTPFALMTFPGDDAPRLISTTGADNKKFVGGDGHGVELRATDGELVATIGEDDWASRGWGAVHAPPGAMWDYLVPRDASGSKALRGVTPASARLILYAAAREVEADPSADRELPATEAAVKAALGGIHDATLVRGVAGIAARAAELSARVAEVAAARAKEHADPSGEGVSAEAAVIRKLAAAFATGKATKIPDFDVELQPWLAHGRALAAIALTPLATEEDRRKARDMVRALSGTMLADDVSRLRLIHLQTEDDWEDPDDWNTLVVLKHQGSWFALHTSGDWALEYSTDGTFRAPPKPYVLGATKMPKLAAIGSEWARAYLELGEEPTPWSAVIAERLAARAELTVAEATLLYNGAPNRDGWGKDFLGKARRELVGLKLGDADTARTTFKEMPDDVLYGIVGAAVPDDPAWLRTPIEPGSFVDRLADAWRAKFGKRTKIPADLIAQAKKDFADADDILKLLPAFTGGLDDAAFLRIDTRPFPELHGYPKGAHGLDPYTGGDLATLIAWLAYARPVGCSIRAGVPSAYARVATLMVDPTLVWKLDDLYVDDADAKGKKRRADLLELVGGDEIDLPPDGDDKCLAARHDGAIIVGLYSNQVMAGFRPAKLEGAAKKKIEALATAMKDDDDPTDGRTEVRYAAVLRSEGLAAIAARVADTDVPDGGWEQNPLASAKKLVGKVARAHGISDAAAALYLQILALAEPTTKNVCTWNGWKPKQYAAAAAELVKKKLVVQGKRERTGRDIFLKGAYDKGDRKNLPMEEWKLPFYPLDRRIPVEPCHLLFARAYKRVEDGDAPGA